METLLQDLKYAVRQLLRTPAFSIAAILALALGIGANVAIFSTVNAVLLNALPFRQLRNPEELVSVYSSNPAILAFISARLPVTFRNFQAWKEQAHSFAGMEAYQDGSLNVTSADSTRTQEPEVVSAVNVTPGFLPLLGVAPRMGRNFALADSNGSNSHVAIISDEFWHARFNADPQILTKSFRASNAQYRIIGVLPARFELPATGQGLDQSKPKLWVPLHLRPTPDEENSMALLVFARLKPDVALTQASAEMKVIAERLAHDHPDFNRGWGSNVFPTINEDVDPDIRTGLYVVQVAVGFVLLIACANVANLLLTKAVSREREMAVRAAVGASRWRIIRQNLTESLLLGFCGGAVGLLLSVAGMKLVSYLAPKEVHGLHELSLDPLVLAFTLGVTFAAGILFGLAPSIHSIRQGIAEALKSGSRSVSGSSKRFRAALVVVEIAMSLILLVGAGLTIRSLVALMSQDEGFRPDHLLTMSIKLPSYQYPNPQQVSTFNDQLLARVQKLPGVQAASLATALPMRSITETSYALPGIPVDPNKLKVTDWSRVTSQHVQALGLHLLEGRNLTADDVNGAHPEIAVVNEAFARVNWPNENALGKVFIFGDEQGKETNFQVVGVVSNAHQFGPDKDSHTEVYIPGHHMQTASLLVRTAGDPLSIANVVKHQIWAIDKDQPVSQVESMESMLSEWVAPRRFTMTLMLGFGVIALISATVGLYSVLAYAVTLRTREIGIRIALGAEPKRVASMILREGLGLTLIGVFLGLAGAYALTGFMQSLIFGISAFDVTTFVAVSVLLTVVAMLASYLPARRAASVNPLDVLRSE